MLAARGWPSCLALQRAMQSRSILCRHSRRPEGRPPTLLQSVSRPESSIPTALCAWRYVSGTILHLKQGPPLTPRSLLEGVRNDGRHLLSVLFYVVGGILRTLNLAEVTSHLV